MRNYLFITLLFSIFLFYSCGEEKSVTITTDIKPFLTTWKTDNEGVSSSTQVTIPINPEYTYNYNVDCNNDGVFEATNVTTSYICEYENVGVYQIAITGDFPAIYFGGQKDKLKIISVDSWGSIKWKSMKAAFAGCGNFNIKADNSPNLSEVTDMSYMFSDASSFDADISSWDVSNVTNMKGMFWDAIHFNQPLNSWNVSNVTNMSYMFDNANSFNQDLSNWDLSNVIDMNNMFIFASAFNGDLSAWDTSNVIDMNNMFYGATSFNHSLKSWDVSNVVYMNDMFFEATSFNQDISNWDVSSVVDMGEMFYRATSFNQDLSNWDVDQVLSCGTFSSDTPSWTLSKPNFTNCNPE